jgi:Terminase small subunit
MAKRAVNWLEIKQRWMMDEPPRLIAPDYKGLTAAQISKKAYLEKWKAEKGINQEKITSEIQKQVVENVLLTRDRLLGELCHIAYANMSDYMDIAPGGGVTLKAWEEMPEDAARAVSKVKEKRKILESSDGQANITLETQLEYGHHDKIKAIALIMQSLGFDKPVNDEDNKAQRIMVQFSTPNTKGDSDA